MRITGIELMRILAVIGVVLIHTHPFGGPEFEGGPLRPVFFIINHASRFAVPFFFVASGYFFGKGLKKGTGPVSLLYRYSRRLMVVFIVFSVGYGLIPLTRAEVIEPGALWYVPMALKRTFVLFIEHPAAFIANGTGIHLWFLPALVAGLSVPVFFMTMRMERYYMPFAVMVYVFGLAAGSYKGLFGMDLGINTRNGPFFSTLFVAIGLWASGREKLPGKGVSAALMAAGLGLQLGEAFFLWEYYGVKMNVHDYLIGTLALGAGSFFMGLNLKKMRYAGVIEPLGRLTLGVYLVHASVMLPVAYVFERRLGALVYQFAYPFCVLFFSVMIAYLARQTALKLRVLPGPGPRSEKALQKRTF